MAGITQNQPPGVASQGQPAAADEAVRICSDLIRIDTTNPGDHSGPGERAAAIGPARPLNRWRAQQTHARQAIRSTNCYTGDSRPYGAPILLGEGIRLYDNPGSEPIRLHRVGEGDPTSAVNVRYRPATAAKIPTERAG
jgi:hypothetical protein